MISPNKSPANDRSSAIKSTTTKQNHKDASIKDLRPESVDMSLDDSNISNMPIGAIDTQTLLETELYQQSIDNAKPNDVLSAARSMVVKFPAVAIGVGFATGGMLGWLTSKRK